MTSSIADTPNESSEQGNGLTGPGNSPRLGSILLPRCGPAPRATAGA